MRVECYTCGSHYWPDQPGHHAHHSLDGGSQAMDQVQAERDAFASRADLAESMLEDT